MSKCSMYYLHSKLCHPVHDAPCRLCPVAWQTATYKVAAALSPMVSEWLHWAEIPLWVDWSHRWDSNLCGFMAQRFGGCYHKHTSAILINTSRSSCCRNDQIRIIIKTYLSKVWQEKEKKQISQQNRQKMIAKDNDGKQVEFLPIS